MVIDPVSVAKAERISLLLSGSRPVFAVTPNQDVIARALADIDARGIAGRDATPYLLGRIVELTDGRSLTANIALVRENARVGAQVAVRYAELSG